MRRLIAFAVAVCGVVTSFPAQAAELDLVDVGGLWATPTATGASAAFWNPGALSGARGTRWHVDVAGLQGQLTYEGLNQEPDSYLKTAALPFVGFATDFGSDDYGFGLSVAVPYAVGADVQGTPESGRYFMQRGAVQALYIMLAGAASFVEDRVHVGVGVGLVHSSWSALLDKELLPGLATAIEEAGSEHTYTDFDLGDPDYAATLSFPGLTDLAYTASVGLLWNPRDKVDVAVSYIAPVAVDNTGEMEIQFGCPPQEDFAGRFIAESTGVCDTLYQADASIAYTLPGRLHLGLAYSPVEAVRLEAMAGLIGWSVYSDFDIQTSGLLEKNDTIPAETAELLEEGHLWARDAQSRAWFGLDTKARFAKRYQVALRAIYDPTAIPDSAVSPNNWDADKLHLGGGLAAQVGEGLTVALAYSHQFIASRMIMDSAFSVSVDPDAQPQGRYNYPSANGQYTGTVDRVALTLSSGF